MANVGPNDPCWCGSGKKYKKCHLSREAHEPVQPYQARQELRDAFDESACLHPEVGAGKCQGKIIRAHTIQRGGGLTRIAKDGHVLCLRPPEIGSRQMGGSFEPKSVGIKLASTFTGFCSRHDTMVFAPLETKPFVPTDEQAFLLTYRPICRELFAKRGLLRSMQLLRKMGRGRDHLQQLAIQDFAETLEEGGMHGQLDLEHHKKVCDTALLSRDFSKVHFLVVQFDRAPDVMCSSGWFPEMDFQGNQIQDLMETPPPASLVAFSLIATDMGGAAVFSWVGDSAVNNALADSLQRVPVSDLSHAVVRFAFEFSENVYFSPTWWESLTPAVQAAFAARAQSGADPMQERDIKCLVDDGLRSVVWSATNVVRH